MRFVSIEAMCRVGSKGRHRASGSHCSPRGLRERGQCSFPKELFIVYISWISE